MKQRRVDVAIIGAGTAGLGARREAEVHRRDWVMIDGGPLGTTCARVGCMPSKLLIAAAEAAHEVRRAGMFGIEVPDGVRVDGPSVLERVRRERDRFVGFVLRATDELPPDRLVRGFARFVGPNTLEVDDGTRIEAETIVIATGSSPWIPPNLDDVRDRVLLNDDIFELPDIPGSIAVVGTGIIALELGQALQRLGSRVAFFNPFDEVGPTRDPAVSASGRAALSAELDLQVGVYAEFSPRGEAGVRVRWVDADGQSREEVFDHVLAAAGRRPNVDSLSLEAADLPLDRHGIPVFDPRTMQVGDRPVFIAGDVNADRPLLHEASDEGHIAGLNASTWPEVRAHVRRTPLGVAFTDPQIAVVGAGYRDLEPGTFVAGAISYDDQGRSRVMGVNRGLVHIYVGREDGLLLGAEMVGPRVEHTAHLLAWAIQARTTVQEALRRPFYHPVVEEGIRTALRDAAAQLRLERRPCASGLDCGPGV